MRWMNKHHQLCGDRMLCNTEVTSLLLKDNKGSCSIG